MKLIVGLGNPGARYEKSRHNLGFSALDRFKKDGKWGKSKGGKCLYLWLTTKGGERVELIKPETFMNDSGISVKYVLGKHPELKLDDIYVVHDDLDIKLGEYKIQLGKGPKDHKGLLSIYEKLKSKNFWHARVGVENRSKDNRILGEDYVLQSFGKEEKIIIDRVVDKIIEDIKERLK
jgi:PTH1 family peptidyl-tRNA hydrolase